MLTEQYDALAVDILRDLVRIDTSNPPGNELAAAVYLQERLAPTGIRCQLLESAPRRGNLLARLPGDGSAKPLLLMGHLDVVSAAGQDWVYPPFAAEIHDEMIWGRGTTDMKQMLAISAVILIALAQSGHPLKRDIILAATADEEKGSAYGMNWLVRNTPELLEAECAINEGGGSSLQTGKHVFYTFQVAEKGVCRTAWTARGADGHASQPNADIAPLHLAQAINNLGDGHIRCAITETMRNALEIIAGYTGERAHTIRLLTQQRIEAALAAAGFEAMAARAIRPLFYDTAAVTVLRAGDTQSINVLPSEARAWVDGRILPGQTEEGYLQALSSRCGQDITIEPLAQQFSPGQELPIQPLLFKVAAAALADAAPDAVLVPWMCSGATDAVPLNTLGIPAYGFIPSMPLPSDLQASGPHSANERIWLRNVQFALHVLYETVVRFCREA